jgi:hypothetical protein
MPGIRAQLLATVLRADAVVCIQTPVYLTLFWDYGRIPGFRFRLQHFIQPTLGRRHCKLPQLLQHPLPFMDAIEQAFQRHPRPQGGAVPTKAALLKRALRTEQRPSHLIQGIHESPWKALVCQGDLTQGTYTWSICTHNEQMAMVKQTSTKPGRHELEKVTKLSEHPHIATLKEVFVADDSWFFQFEYARFTLEEVLSVHTRLAEPHIRVIASSVRHHLTQSIRTNLADLPRDSTSLWCWDSSYCDFHRHDPILQRRQVSSL